MTGEPRAVHLWLNADDFGLTRGVSQGIVEAMTRGVVQSTTAMVCTSVGVDCIAELGPRIADRVGLHLQLTDGHPVSAVSGIPTLVGRDHRFPRRPAELGELDRQQILKEWRAQLETISSLGVTPTHLDTHHDVHWRAEALQAYIQLALENDLPARGGPDWLNDRLRSAGVRCPDAGRTWADIEPPSIGSLLSEAGGLGETLPLGGVIQLGCHPGYVDEDLAERSRYCAPRPVELAVLCDSALVRSLRAAGIHLAPFEEVIARLRPPAVADHTSRERSA